MIFIPRKHRLPLRRAQIGAFTPSWPASWASHPAVGPAGVTWNPADKDPAGVTLSNGNLTALGSGGFNVRATTSHSTGKYYFEVVYNSVAAGSSTPMAGIAYAAQSLTGAMGYGIGGHYAIVQSTPAFTYKNGSYASDGATFANSDVLNVAVDFGATKIWFGKNGTWMFSGNPAGGTNQSWIFTADTYFPIASVQGGAEVTANFASGSWAYTAPSGFGAW